MTRSIIDPVTRIEGHLRVEMEVRGGRVVDAWTSGGCFRGMESVVTNRTPEDAAHIVQRICGVCPVSHSHASSIATEKACCVEIPNGARIIRNIIECCQFLLSHVQWFYTLCSLDYVNPLNALKANIADTYDLAEEAGARGSDFKQIQTRLKNFAENGQLSIFSGNWFNAEESAAYKLSPEADLICTAHYLEALKVQARISEILSLLGGKMPHVMTILPGGTRFVPTVGKLDDLKALVEETTAWVDETMFSDVLLIAKNYPEVAEFGRGPGRYVAWGAFEGAEFPYGGDYIEQMRNRYLPMGILDERLNLSDVDENKIAEDIAHSWYKGDRSASVPAYETIPDFDKYDVQNRYSWVKSPTYDGLAMEATPLARMLVAYKRVVKDVVDGMDNLIVSLGASGINDLQNTLGRTAIRSVECQYLCKLLNGWVDELIDIVKSGDATYFKKPEQTTGVGTGFWEAPRGALFHSESIKKGIIDGYQIIIPSTWNLCPMNSHGEKGPLEQALIGVPVEDVHKPINALRTIHSFDPCTACSVHVSEVSTAKKFSTITNPMGVK